MASSLASGSSSSAKYFSSSSAFKNETKVLGRMVNVPVKAGFSACMGGIHSKNHGRRHVQLQSTNGHLLDAVSLQDDGMPVADKNINLLRRDEMPIHISDADKESTLSITVVGASGDLAKKKIFPALFALFYEDWLPENFAVFGYARTNLTDEELRNMISKTLTCRINQRENCEDKMNRFLERCFYHAGQYNSEEHFLELDKKLKEKEVMCLTQKC